MGTHPIFESDFDCLTERDGFPGKVEMADAEKSLTVDNGPDVLDRKTEHILKRRKQYQGIKRKEKEIARTTRTKRSAPTIQFKRLEHLARGKKMGKRDEIRIKRNVQRLLHNSKAMKAKENVKMVLVIRIRTADGIGKMAIRAMRQLRVMNMYHAAFVRYDDKTHRMLKTAEPYITWGEVDVRTIRDLLTKRGFAVVDGKRMILNSNTAVEDALGSIDMIAIEDLIKELVSVGDKFDTVNAFLAPFELSAPAGGMKKDNFVSVEKGGQFGDRGKKINELVQSMT